MPQVWNPNEPDVLGMEWRPVIPFGVNIAAEGPWSMTLRSRSAETIEKLRWSGRGTQATDQHMMIVDIYERGQEIGQAGTTPRVVEYAPTVDTNVGGWRRVADNGTTNLFQKINELPVAYPPVRTDYGIYTTTAHDQYRCRVGSGAFPLTARVLNVSYKYIVSSMGFEWRPTNAFLHWSGAGGPLFWQIPGAYVTTHAYGILVEVSLGEINPRTLAPWTPADIRAFSTASGYEMRFQAVADTTVPAQLTTAALRVYYADSEKRKAAAIWRRPALDLSRPTMFESDRIVTMPGGTANWVKANAIDYSFVHRIADDPLVQQSTPRGTDITIDRLIDPGPGTRQPRIPGEASYGDVPVPGMAAGLVTLDQYASRVLAINAQPSADFTVNGGGYSPVGIPALMLIKSGTVVSEDSQPYGHGWWLSSFANPVQTGTEEYQEVVPPSTQTYLGVDFNVQPPREAANQATTLTVQVKTTGGANVGGSFTITAAQARALPFLWYDHVRVKGWLSAGAALTGGTTYRITFNSNAPATDPWYIGTAGVPDFGYTFAGTPPPNGDAATFQGAAQSGTYAASPDDAIDLMVTLIKQPAIPTAPTAAVTEVSNDTPDVMCQLYCASPVVEVVTFSWTASTYTGFARWRVQREEADKPNVWVDLVTITSEAQKSYVDVGARREVAVRYRVRAELASGSFTEWAPSTQVTPRAKGNEVIFTSDARPDLTVAYDRDPEVTYEFLSVEEDTFAPVAGADFQRVFMASENRGTRFNLDVHVNVIHEPDADRKGAGAFVPLLALARAQDIPYVVLLDHEGQRFLVHLQVPSGLSRQPEHEYETTVTCTEVADTPVVLTQP